MNKIPNLLSIAHTSRVLLRNYAFKSDLKIKWVRPEKISCIKPEKSGDLSGTPKIDLSIPLLEFQKSKELEKADPTVKKIFSLDFNPRKKTTDFLRMSLIDEVKRHDLDLGSMESKLADMTAHIRCLQDLMEILPKNKKTKVQLKELIDKRKRFLRYLRRWDYRRFEWILEKLDLVFKPYPTKYHWITRKDSLRKLTDIHCENIRNERLTEYRKKLESQQLDFLANKIKILEFIRKEQADCQVPVTVSSEEIEDTRKKYSKLLEARKNNNAEKE